MHRKGDLPERRLRRLGQPDDTPETIEADQTTDVSAPGYAGVPSAGGARTEAHGTGAAAAHVSGAAALLRGLAPKLSPAQIRQVLVSTSRPVSGFLTANQAHGIIDVEAAVRAVQSMEGLVTPAPGQGAPVDSPDPFAGQTIAPVVTPPATPTPPTPVVTPPKSLTHVAVSLGKVPPTVAAGATLKLHLDVTGGAGTVTATLAHGKAKLARATRRGASGDLTLKLHLPRGARRGAAKLTVQIAGARALVRPITVTKPR